MTACTWVEPIAALGIVAVMFLGPPAFMAFIDRSGR